MTHLIGEASIIVFLISRQILMQKRRVASGDPHVHKMDRFFYVQQTGPTATGYLRVS